MSRFRDRLRRLERETEGGMTLVCPECGEEFVVAGDVAAEYIVFEWSKEVGQKGHHETPEDMARVFAHEHYPGAFVEKQSCRS